MFKTKYESFVFMQEKAVCFEQRGFSGGVGEQRINTPLRMVLEGTFRLLVKPISLGVCSAL
jgi:hypothetical protein